MKKIFSAMLLTAFLSSGMHTFAQETIKVGTTVRNMITYVPEDLPYSAPLVISLHGMNQDANYQRSQAKWESVADTAKFVVVYPNGINRGWDISGMTDINFIEAIIDTMYARHHINRNRVYLSGFSMGGMMTYHAMAKLGDKIAAFGPVSGIPVDYRNPSGTRPVPIIHTHGTADDVVHYNGDPNHMAGGYGSIPDYVKKWAAFDGCDTEHPDTIQPYPSNKPGSSATYIKYSDANDSIEVVLISIGGKGHWHSNDPASVITTEEIWNFCKRYSLGPAEPAPPTLFSANPENQSFDLPASFLKYEFVFDVDIDCGQVTAELAGNGTSYNLTPSEEGWSSKLTLNLPQDAEPTDGDYTLTIHNIVNEAGGKLESCTFHYSYGLSDVGLELAIDTLLLPDWYAEQGQVGEGIPYGWKRVNSRADGSKDEKESGAANTGGARLKYFPTGGDFDAGFYLSARDFDVCRFYYGDYEENRLYLESGKYVLSFNSIYWSASSETGNATFDVSVSELATGASLFSKTGLLSSGCLYEVNTDAVSGSKSHEYILEILQPGNYLLEFKMSQGWNSVIIGNVKLTTKPSVADVYKGGFLRTLENAKQLYVATDNERYSDSENLRKALSDIIVKYEYFVSTAPSAYETATSEIKDFIEPLDVRKVCVDLYFTAYDTALDLLDECEGNIAYESSEAYLKLKSVMETYAVDSMDLTDETALRTTAGIIEDLVNQLSDLVTTIKDVDGTEQPISVEYFDMSGKQVLEGQNGIVIVRKTYSGGKTEAKTVIL